MATDRSLKISAISILMCKGNGILGLLGEHRFSAQFVKSAPASSVDVPIAISLEFDINVEFKQTAEAITDVAFVAAFAVVAASAVVETVAALFAVAVAQAAEADAVALVAVAVAAAAFAVDKEGYQKAESAVAAVRAPN